MNKHNKHSIFNTYQKVLLDEMFVVLKTFFKINSVIFHYLTSNKFINKELEIVFANIRV